MISHNSLEERLSAVRSGKPIPSPPLPPKPYYEPNKEVVNQTGMTYKQFFINEGYKIFGVLSTSLIYGFGLKAIFSTDWKFTSILGVGFLLNHFLTIILKLSKRK